MSADRLAGSRPPATDGAARQGKIAEVPLTRCIVGMWSSRRHCACHLLLSEQQLVVLVDMSSSMPRSPSRFGALHGRLAAASPFLSSSQAGCVHAFEVPLSSIRGLDYSNPLVLEARLVLETVGLRKREFPTVGRLRLVHRPSCLVAQACGPSVFVMCIACLAPVCSWR